MKKIFTKKYNNLLMLSVVSIASIVIPTGAVLGNTDYVNTHVTGGSISFGYSYSKRPADGSQRYAQTT